jgi:CHAT domain-containing protein/Tfp pilus assembly protein PilF
VHEAQGQTYERQNDSRSAEQSYRAVLAIRQAAGAPTLAEANALVDLAFVALAGNDLARAEENFHAAADIQQKLAPDSFVLAKTLSNLGNLAQARGDLDAAATLYRKGAALLEALMPESAEFGRALNNLGTLSTQRGDLTEAADLHQRALGIHNRLDASSVDVAASLTNLGLVASAGGRLAEAERFYRRALAIYERRAPGTPDEATTLANLASVLARRGDLMAAEDYHRRALAIRERISPNTAAVAGSLNDLGLLSSQRGDPIRAEDYYRRSLAIMERLAPDSLDTARTLNNLGEVAAERTDYGAAEALLKRALAIKQRNAPGSALVAGTLSNLGELAETRGDLSAAHEQYEAARALLEAAAPESLELATVLGNLADVAERRGDAAVANVLAARSLAIAQRLAPDSESHAQALRRIGLQAFRNGELQRAAMFFERSINALESQTTRLGGSNEVRTTFSGRSHTYYVEYVDTLIALGQPARAFEALERSRARALLTMLAERDLVLDEALPSDVAEANSKVNEEYDRAQETLAGLNPGRDTVEIERLQTRLRDLRESRARVIEKIRGASPRLAALKYPQPLSLERIQQALDPGTTLLSYDIGKDKSHLFVVQRGHGGPARLTVHTMPVGDAGLRAQIATLRRLIERQGDSREGPSPAFIELARQLFNLLIAPAEDAVDTADRVLISPDGPLHGLPFAALIRSNTAPGGRSWQYLVEWKPVHTVVSATVYAELKKASPPAGPATLVAFGDPVYPVSSDHPKSVAKSEFRGVLGPGSALSPLPATRVEVETLARKFGEQATTYLGADATEARAKSVKKTRYLHFATHSLLDARFPLNSALALTVPAQRREGEENGLLQAWEIFEQVRIDADLVTLSACETALGAELAGEGLVGLTRAFHYAGARSVLASLWRVADTATADLMGDLYGNLKSGVTKDEALRRAQLAAINQPNTAAPFYWAAFTLSGDWR